MFIMFKQFKSILSGAKESFMVGFNEGVSDKSDFRDLLVFNPDSSEFAKVAGVKEEFQADYRLFNLLDTRSGALLSIQASEHHLCTPKITMNPVGYTSWTLAFITPNKQGIARPLDTGLSFDLADELHQYQIEVQDLVYGNVPTDLVQRIYLDSVRRK